MAKSTSHDLGVLLADFHILYQKLRGYHWNVRGPHFYGLHEHFEGLYDTMAETIDDLAERIRALGEFPPSTYAQYLKLATLKEDPKQPEYAAMVANLVADFEALSANVAAARTRAVNAGDEETADQLTGLRRDMQKSIWMLKANLA